MKSDVIIVGLDIGTTKIALVAGRKNKDGEIEILGYGKIPLYDQFPDEESKNDHIVESIRDLVAEVSLKAGVEIKSVNVVNSSARYRTFDQYGTMIRDNCIKKITQEEVDRFCDKSTLPMSQGEKVIRVIPQEFNIGSLIRGNESSLELKARADKLTDEFGFKLASGEFFVKYIPKRFLFDEDNGIIDPVGKTGLILETKFIIVVGEIDAEENLCKCIMEAGLIIGNIILEPFASAAAVLTDNEKQSGVLMVDIGGHTSTLVIYQKGIIRHTAFIPLGAENLTEDLMGAYSIKKEQAEKLKVKFCSALANEYSEDEIIVIPGAKGKGPKEINRRHMIRTIQLRLEEIFEKVINEIKNAGHEKKLQGGIVITGGGALLKQVDKFAQYWTAKDTRIGYPARQLANAVSGELSSPMYATSLGIVISGLSRTEKTTTRKNK